MSSKLELNALLRLYELQKDSFDKRRGIQWKVSVGFWTGIIVSTGFLLSREDWCALPSSCWAWGVFALLGVVFWTWLLRLQYSNRLDEFYINRYRNRVEAILKTGCRCLWRRHSLPRWWRGFLDIWIGTQAGITFIFLGCSWFLLTDRQDITGAAFLFLIAVVQVLVALLGQCCERNNHQMDIDALKAAIQAHRVRISDHADEEAATDELTLEEIYHSVLHGEIIEEYPTDRPFPSCLIYGNTRNGGSVSV